MKKQQTKKIPLKKHPEKKGLPTKIKEKHKNYFNLLAVMIIIVLGIVVYSNSFKCTFHYDDFASIIDNNAIRNLWDLNSIWQFSPNRPIAIFSFALNYHYGQLDVRYWHYVNLLIHLMTAVVVWWLTLLVFSTPALKDHKLNSNKQIIALLTALLFVSHPLATQSVVYIVQRMASMVAMFYLLSTALYVQGRLLPKGSVWKYVLFVGSLMVGVLALFTKENAYTLPFALVMAEFFLFRKKKLKVNFKDYRVLLGMGVVAAAFVLMVSRFSLGVLKPITATETHTATLTPFTYLFTEFGVIVKYIQMLLFPMNQMVDYDYPVAESFFNGRSLIGFVILAACIVVGIVVYKKHRMISFGIFWFIPTLAIESSIIPINDVIFEHRTYLPSFGFFLILTSVVFILLQKKYKSLAVVILLIIVASNSYLTFQRNKVWKDELTLWSDNVAKAPKLARPLTNRGFAYRNIGMWEKALDDYSKAIQLSPNYTIALNDRGVAWDHFGKYNNAIADYSRAIKINPNFTDAYSNRCAAYGSMGQNEKALADISKAIELNGNYYKAYSNRGNLYSALNQPDKAIADYTKALELNSNYADAYSNRGNACGKLKQFDKALADYSKAISLNPDFAEAYNNRGITYGALNDWNKAAVDFGETIRINPKFVQAYVNRGVAFAKTGQNEKALADFEKALSIDPSYTSARINRDKVLKSLNKSSR